MKTYEVTPRSWNKSHTNLEALVYDSSSFSTYADAVACAVRMSDRFARVDIELFELKRSDCIDQVHFESEWECNRGEYLKWTESFSGGRQVPAVFFGETPVWRWGANNKDLKPRKS